MHLTHINVSCDDFSRSVKVRATSKMSPLLTFRPEFGEVSAVANDVKRSIIQQRLEERRQERAKELAAREKAHHLASAWLRDKEGRETEQASPSRHAKSPVDENRRTTKMRRNVRPLASSLVLTSNRSAEAAYRPPHGGASTPTPRGEDPRRSPRRHGRPGWDDSTVVFGEKEMLEEPPARSVSNPDVRQRMDRRMAEKARLQAAREAAERQFREKTATTASPKDKAALIRRQREERDRMCDIDDAFDSEALEEMMDSYDPPGPGSTTKQQSSLPSIGKPHTTHGDVQQMRKSIVSILHRK